MSEEKNGKKNLTFTKEKTSDRINSYLRCGGDVYFQPSLVQSDQELYNKRIEITQNCKSRIKPNTAITHKHTKYALKRKIKKRKENPYIHTQSTYTQEKEKKKEKTYQTWDFDFFLTKWVTSSRKTG